MNAPALKDYLLRSANVALPNGAASTNSATFDLGHNATRGNTPKGPEILITAPAMGATPMGNGKTMVYAIYHDDASNMGSEVALIPQVLVQTGAGGTGCAAATARVRLPKGCKRYVRVKATGSTTGDASGSSFDTEFLF